MEMLREESHTRDQEVTLRRGKQRRMHEENENEERAGEELYREGNKARVRAQNGI